MLQFRNIITITTYFEHTSKKKSFSTKPGKILFFIASNNLTNCNHIYIRMIDSFITHRSNEFNDDGIKLHII